MIFAAFALVLLAGHGLLRMGRFSGESGPEHFAWSWIAGCAWTGLLATGISFLDSCPVWVLPGLLGSSALLPLFAPSPRPCHWRRDWIGFLPLILLAAPLFWLADAQPVSAVDAQMRWVYRAQTFAATGSLTPPSLTEEAATFAHPTYPPTIPALLGVGLILGADADHGLRDAWPIFLLALLGLLWGPLRRANSRAAPFLLLALALTPALSWLESRGSSTGLGATSLLADLPLALFVTALLVPFWEALRADRLPAWLPVTLATVAVALTKQEGLALALVALPLTALVFRHKEKISFRRTAWMAWLAALAAGLLWRWASADLPVAPGEHYLGADLGSVFSSLPSRALPIAAAVGQQFVDFSTWGLLWPMAFLGLCFALAKRQKEGLLLGLWLILGIGVAAAGYLASGWRDGNFIHLMDVSLTRLLLHVAPMAVLLVVSLSTSNQPAPHPNASS